MHPLILSYQGMQYLMGDKNMRKCKSCIYHRYSRTQQCRRIDKWFNRLGETKACSHYIPEIKDNLISLVIDDDIERQHFLRNGG
jgi:hypothetical protein